jgi:hypothetical protein
VRETSATKGEKERGRWGFCGQGGNEREGENESGLVDGGGEKEEMETSI